MEKNIVKTKIDWFEIYTFQNDGIGGDIIKGILWEPHIIDFLKNNLNKELTFVDVGSNYGWHSIIASKFCKQVFSFEPQKRMFDIQKMSIDENKIKNINLFNFAVGEKNKKGQMNYINYDLNWVNIGDLSLGNGGEEIEIKDIDSLMLPKIDIIKIDVQGYEKFVLEGTLNKINSDKPIIIIELENFQMQKFDYDDSYIFSFFKNLGYISFYLESNYPSDHVFVHESQINSFYEKNKILNLTEKNLLNNNLDNGVKFKIIKK
jgi:FkbM family methyltransferase